MLFGQMRVTPFTKHDVPFQPCVYWPILASVRTSSRGRTASDSLWIYIYVIFRPKSLSLKSLHIDNLKIEWRHLFYGNWISTKFDENSTNTVSGAATEWKETEWVPFVCFLWQPTIRIEFFSIFTPDIFSLKRSIKSRFISFSNWNSREFGLRVASWKWTS